MLADINSEFYNYIRGAILVLSLYHLFIYSQNRNKQFLFYSLYFLSIFLFFAGQGIFGHTKANIFHYVTPTLHCGTFIFYISFARIVLKTEERIPFWDSKMVAARTITVVMAAVFLLTVWLFGFRVQSYLFMIMGPLTLLFTFISYWHFLKIQTQTAKLFLMGSILYTLGANLSFFAGYIYGYEGFIAYSSMHPTLFMYVGSILEAIVFALLIGNSITVLEIEKKETTQEIENLKRLVIKNHIVLKDKTKVYISDLVFVKSEDHYLNLYLSNGKSHLVRGKLSDIKEELPPNFIQCHRSYIVNSNFIKQMNSTSISLMNRESVPISRSYKRKT